MSRDIFRMFKPHGDQEDPVAKRRGQLRRAQNTYRERKKERYTKRLEEELIQTRSREANLREKCQQLEDTTRILAQCLSHNGIEIPMGSVLEDKQEPIDQVSPSVPDSVPDSSTAWTSSQSPEASTAHEYSPFTGFSLATNPSGNQSLGPPFFQNQPPSQNMSLDQSHSALITKQQHVQLSDTNHSSVGMEFVLILESPCRDHLHGSAEKPEEPGYHAFTASAQIGPHSDTTAILDRLLRLSPEFCSESEVTPVQMWDRIRREAQGGTIDPQRLKQLAEKLRDSAQCHGFGAVVEAQIFESLLVENVWSAFRS